MQNIFKTIIRNNYSSLLHGLSLGLGLNYAIRNEKYIHIPLCFLIPTVYVGYNIYEIASNTLLRIEHDNKP